MSTMQDAILDRIRGHDRGKVFTPKDFLDLGTLKQIFTLPDSPAGLLFKGGTLLSKVFGAIERFAEDVDLSFDRAGLGFGGDSEPSRKSRGVITRSASRPRACLR